MQDELMTSDSSLTVDPAEATHARETNLTGTAEPGAPFHDIAHRVAQAAPAPAAPAVRWRSDGARARELLRHLLRDGPVFADEIRRATQRDGLGWRTIQRAASQAGIHRIKSGMNAGWCWALRTQVAEDANLGGIFGDDRVAGHGEEPVTCLAAYGYEVPNDGLMHGVPWRD